MIYALGDIHGQKAFLDDALALIEADGGPDAQIVFLGDYTDRGLHSKDVLETLIEGQKEGRNWIFIKGNHDLFFSNFVKSGNQFHHRVKSGINWLNTRLGGMATLASYGVTADIDPTFIQNQGELEQIEEWLIDGVHHDAKALSAVARAHVPQHHLDFLDGLPLSYETDDLIFVHAGLRPNVAFADQDPEDLIWIRDGFMDSTFDFGRIVVHGHTALDAPKHFGNHIDLDGGAGYGRPLVPAVFDGRSCWTLTPNGRVPLEPTPS